MSNSNYQNKKIFRKDIMIGSIDILFSFLEYSSDYIFRGQSCSKWGLSTTIERNMKGRIINANGLERRIISEFKRYSRHYLNDTPDNNDTLQWLSLIQHYGGPTRLLDFTHSLFIAAFFAMNRSIMDPENNEDAAIWAIKTQSLSHLISVNDIDITIKTGSYLKENSEILHKAIYSQELNGVKGVVYAEPRQSNKRLDVQQGLFLFPIDIECSFEENLYSIYNANGIITEEIEEEYILGYKKVDKIAFYDIIKNADILKIIIPNCLHGKLLKTLHKMNINYHTLFPDIEGVARSMYDIENMFLSRNLEFNINI